GFERFPAHGAQVEVAAEHAVDPLLVGEAVGLGHQQGLGAQVFLSLLRSGGQYRGVAAAKAREDFLESVGAVPDGAVDALLQPARSDEIDAAMELQLVADA